VLRILIRDPVSGAFLTPGSGMSKKIRIRIRDEQLGSYFRELRNNFFGFKILKFFYVDPGSGMGKFGSGIWDGKNSDPGSGMEKIRIRNSGFNVRRR
jgi:hypothetical protein